MKIKAQITEPFIVYYISMNKFILQQLKKCTFADLSNYDKEQGIYIIKKYQKPNYKIGKCYIIQIPKYLLNNSTSLLATNWNNGSFPKDEFCKVYVSKILGTYVYVDSIAYDYENKVDLSNIWSGWLDSKELNQITEI